jgi:ribonuclease VapC
VVVDASALLAIALQEEDAARYALAFSNLRPRFISAATLLEATIAVTARKSGQGWADLDELVKALSITVVEFGSSELAEARRAFDIYGKGRHPARLNFGDCMAYATAKVRDQPLLYKGNDFALTDIAAAL